MSINEPSTHETLDTDIRPPKDLNNFGLIVTGIALPDSLQGIYRTYYEEEWHKDVAKVIGNFTRENAMQIIHIIELEFEKNGASFKELIQKISRKVMGAARRDLEEPIFIDIKESLKQLGGLFGDIKNLEKIMLMLCGYSNGDTSKYKLTEQ